MEDFPVMISSEEYPQDQLIYKQEYLVGDRRKIIDYFDEVAVEIVRRFCCLVNSSIDEAE